MHHSCAGPHISPEGKCTFFYDFFKNFITNHVLVPSLTHTMYMYVSVSVCLLSCLHRQFHDVQNPVCVYVCVCDGFPLQPLAVTLPQGA